LVFQILRGAVGRRFSSAYLAYARERAQHVDALLLRPSRGHLLAVEVEDCLTVGPTLIGVLQVAQLDDRAVRSPPCGHRSTSPKRALVERNSRQKPDMPHAELSRVLAIGSPFLRRGLHRPHACLVAVLVGDDSGRRCPTVVDDHRPGGYRRSDALLGNVVRHLDVDMEALTRGLVLLGVLEPQDRYPSRGVPDVVADGPAAPGPGRRCSRSAAPPTPGRSSRHAPCRGRARSW
jgi:hypothetical protein